MILHHLPALDLLVLQRVNMIWKNIINKSKIIQMKLFMEQDPPEEQWGNAFGANGLRWNPFLEHFGVPIKTRPGSHWHRVRLKREDLRKKHCPRASWKEILRRLDRPEASWKKMYVSYPTRLIIRAGLVPYIAAMTSDNCRYTSEKEAVRMEFLTKVDRKCTSNGRRSGRDSFDISCWVLMT